MRLVEGLAIDLEPSQLFKRRGPELNVTFKSWYPLIIAFGYQYIDTRYESACGERMVN